MTTATVFDVALVRTQPSAKQNAQRAEWVGLWYNEPKYCRGTGRRKLNSVASNRRQPITLNEMNSELNQSPATTAMTILTAVIGSSKSAVLVHTPPGTISKQWMHIGVIVVDSIDSPYRQ